MNNSIIFIDANVYLRFYDSASNRFKSLLQTLIELKGSIFITEQICREVDRNKLSTAEKSFSANSKTLGIKKTTLPEHLDIDADEKLKKWNNSRNNIIQEEEKLKKEYSLIVGSTLESIMKSEDNVSKTLSIIFATSLSASLDEISAGRLRKELGNPPGKSGDPLGDQLTWEQLLTIYKNQEIWLITNDSDYLTEYGGSCYLNPYLYKELKVKSNNYPPKINVFNGLAEGIADYNANLDEKLVTLPSDVEMEEIIIEEEKIIRNILASSNIQSIGYDEKKSILEVEFRGGSVYQYFDVPIEIYEGMLASSSAGFYFAKKIKGFFPFSKIN